MSGPPGVVVQRRVCRRHGGGSRLNEAENRGRLRWRIPGARTRESDRSSMEWLVAGAISAWASACASSNVRTSSVPYEAAATCNAVLPAMIYRPQLAQYSNVSPFRESLMPQNKPWPSRVTWQEAVKPGCCWPKQSRRLAPGALEQSSPFSNEPL